ncbi:MAG: phospholipase D-like domain-containing protein [Candidatus Acidiferrales bacterium]
MSDASQSLVLCAPYVSRGPCERIARRIKSADSSFSLDIITDLSRDNVLSCFTDAAALAMLVRSASSASVRFLPSLHAKVYIADELRAIVTSANLTDGGLIRNFEYGAVFDDPNVVRAIRDDVLQYGSLGSLISLPQLDALARIAEELREVRKAAERSIRSTLRREFERRLREVDDQILRARTAGKTAHAIFAEAIRHLLRRGPLTTVQIHEGVRRIHPDLCDDSVDRVIDGRHFGKKWKHEVRTAQVFLRRRAEIELEGDRWRLVR